VEHAIILVDNQVRTVTLVEKILANRQQFFDTPLKEKLGVFSQQQLALFIEEEERHDLKILTASTSQSLKSMSSGERKKALLDHLLSQNFDGLILVNPYDNLDVKAQSELKDRFCALGQSKQLIQILSRSADRLPLPANLYRYSNDQIVKHTDFKDPQDAQEQFNILSNIAIPPNPNPISDTHENLVTFKNVAVNFEGNHVLNNINWNIKKGDFWELLGPNGSGKTTILNMITGDSPKSYQQDVTIFGHKKGSGESVWDIKEFIGYFTPAMTDRFRGYHSLEHMLISGLHDSIGLYQKPTGAEKRLAQTWLQLLHLESKKDFYFQDLSLGEKRLLMTARAMVKHPPLLILDEPTAGLDDQAASFFVALVNKFAKESDSAIVFVSHRKEPGLHPKQCLELVPTKKGSVAKIHYI